MSRMADLVSILKNTLGYSDKESHAVVVRMFYDMLEEGWDDEDTLFMLDRAVGITIEADVEINKIKNLIKSFEE